jgi:hypothetical protein
MHVLVLLQRFILMLVAEALFEALLVVVEFISELFLVHVHQHHLRRLVSATAGALVSFRRRYHVRVTELPLLAGVYVPHCFRALAALGLGQGVEFSHMHVPLAVAL